MIEKIKNLMDPSMIRFVIVGVINTLVGTTVMFALYNLAHMGYWFSSAANYVVGSIVSYFLNKNWTFKNKEHSVAVVVRFVINIAVCYLLAYGIAKPLVRLVLSGASETIRDNLSMLAGMCLFVFFNYFGQRFFAFRESGNKTE